MGFLGRLFEGAKRFIGKVKPVLGAGIKLYDKMAGKYDNLKSTISNLPVLGTAAAELVKQGEQKLTDVIKEKTGFDPSMIGKGVNVARTIEGMLPG